jgi:nucleoside-diphosphate-sugar epimerase
MKSILITEISDFVGGHFTQSLMNEQPDFVIYGVRRTKPARDFIHLPNQVIDAIAYHQCDLGNPAIYDSLIKEEKRLNG